VSFGDDEGASSVTARYLAHEDAHKSSESLNEAKVPRAIILAFGGVIPGSHLGISQLKHHR
jgi:hypothetical protein